MTWVFFLFNIIILFPIYGHITTSIDKYFIDAEQMTTNSVKRIDKIYVINLDMRPEKWNYITNAFREYNISPLRFSAFNGAQLSENDKQILFGDFPIRLSRGQLGCIISHLSCLRDCAIRDLDIVWICEDDIQILGNPHLLTRYLTALMKIDPDWDVLYTDRDTFNNLGLCIPSVSSDFRPDMEPIQLEKINKRTIVSLHIMRLGQRFGNYSYIVSAKGARKILEYYHTHFIWAPYDIEIHYIPDIREYSLRKDLVSINWKITISDTGGIS